MDFYTTQLMDEARHAYAFRGHLLELGVPEKDLEAVMEELAGADRDAILTPLEEFGLAVLRDGGDYIGGVITLTVLVEGVLAPHRRAERTQVAALRPARRADRTRRRHRRDPPSVRRYHHRPPPSARSSRGPTAYRRTHRPRHRDCGPGCRWGS
ncbi:hypothetical protein GCM10020256_06500 [Streptomyces thermocoprophilus]